MRHRFNPWVGKIPRRGKWQPTTVFLAGKSHGQRSLVGYNSWGCKELDTTEHTHIYKNRMQKHKKDSLNMLASYLLIYY